MADNIFDGSTDSNWGTAANWSLGTVPTASDGHVAKFDATSPNCTVNTSARVCNNLDFTGYTNTITMSQQITVSGNVTLISGLLVSGSGALIVNATSTLTSNGFTWPNALTLNGTSTHTLADNWAASGLITLGGSNLTTTINANTLTANGGVTFGVTTGIVTGTTLLKIGGTGMITGPSGAGQCRLSMTIDAAGSTVTFANAAFNFNTGTLTYTAGTMSMGTASLAVAVANATLACAGINWPAASISGNITVTLSENLNISGLTTLGATTTSTVINGSQINANGGVRHSTTTGNISGTTVLNVSGAGTLDSSGMTTSRGILMPITINASGATVNSDSPFLVDLGKLLLTAGTVTTDTGTWAAGSSGAGSVFGATGGLVT